MRTNGQTDAAAAALTILNAVSTARPNLSKFENLRIRRPTLMNFIKFDGRRISLTPKWRMFRSGAAVGAARDDDVCCEDERKKSE